MRQRAFIKKAGSEAVVWIDPRKVEFYAGTKEPVAKQQIQSLKRRYPKFVVDYARPFLKASEPLVVPGECFGRLSRLEDHGKYQKILDFIQSDGELTETIWYRELIAVLKRDGEVRYKHLRMLDEESILGFLRDYVSALVQSMRDHGFDDPNGGFEATGMLDADGSIRKTGSGDHRFHIGRVLGLERFPLRIIGIHRQHFGPDRPRSSDTYERALKLIRQAENHHA